jgi:hypothetical protein
LIAISGARNCLPERVTQGNAFEEITTVPQIVSGTSPRALRNAEPIFGATAPSVVQMEPREAELAKLVCNAFRYMLFAATNSMCSLSLRESTTSTSRLSFKRNETRDPPRGSAGPLKNALDAAST